MASFVYFKSKIGYIDTIIEIEIEIAREIRIG